MTDRPTPDPIETSTVALVADSRGYLVVETARLAPTSTPDPDLGDLSPTLYSLDGLADLDSLVALVDLDALSIAATLADLDEIERSGGAATADALSIDRPARDALAIAVDERVASVVDSTLGLGLALDPEIVADLSPRLVSVVEAIYRLVAADSTVDPALAAEIDLARRDGRPVVGRPRRGLAEVVAASLDRVEARFEADALDPSDPRDLAEIDRLDAIAAEVDEIDPDDLADSIVDAIAERVGLDPDRLVDLASVYLVSLAEAVDRPEREIAREIAAGLAVDAIDAVVGDLALDGRSVSRPIDPDSIARRIETDRPTLADSIVGAVAVARRRRDEIDRPRADLDARLAIVDALDSTLASVARVAETPEAVDALDARLAEAVASIVEATASRRRRAVESVAADAIADDLAIVAARAVEARLAEIVDPEGDLDALDSIEARLGDSLAGVDLDAIGFFEGRLASTVATRLDPTSGLARSVASRSVEAVEAGERAYRRVVVETVAERVDRLGRLVGDAIARETRRAVERAVGSIALDRLSGDRLAEIGRAVEVADEIETRREAR